MTYPTGWLFCLLLVVLIIDLFLVKHYDGSIQQQQQQTQKPILLVLVIAGGETKPYDFYRHFWMKIADIMQEKGIHIYLISYSSKSSAIRYHIYDHSLTFPGENSLIPGCLESTIKAMETIQDRRLTGYDAPKILRTNLSTFWNFWMIFKYLSRSDMNVPYLYAGLSYHMNRDYFIPGGYLFLNRASMMLLIRNQTELDMSIIDDLSIGRFFRTKNIELIYNLKACMIEDASTVEKVLNNQICQDDFIFRIKTINQLDDSHLWLYLFKEYYTK